MSASILVVDDEKMIRWSLRQRLEKDGYKVDESEDGASARERFRSDSYDVALFDVRLPDTDGITLLNEFHAIQPDVPVIIITAYSSLEGAVGAMKGGASDYLAKPFDMDELSLTVQRVYDSSVMRNNLNTDLDQKRSQFGLDNIIGISRQIQEVKTLIRKVAKGQNTTILLLGDSGTGKDLVARALHYESTRGVHPFMNITCTALPESLLESELFGYEAGAFTNAMERKKGLIELANRGTVFLDEIGDMSPTLQAKLLRVLEDKCFKRIGGVTDIHVDTRFVAATNRNLAQMVQEGTFREDLYYRLNVVPIQMPPLRDRGGDIPLLARYFLQIFNREFRKSIERFSFDALERLNTYPWPGNVREMRNVIERAVLLNEGDIIEKSDIVLGRALFSVPQGGAGDAVLLPPGGCSLAEAEASLLRQALERTEWNQTHTGTMLGISRDQVRYKMDKYNLKNSDD
jgi:two-component system, NtrC family, response regulator AtoC